MEIAKRVCHMVKNTKKKPAKNEDSLIIINYYYYAQILYSLNFNDPFGTDRFLYQLDCFIGISTSKKNCIST